MTAINWTEELEAEIIQAIADGKTLREIAHSKGFSASCIVDRKIKSASFGEQYARAKCIQMESMADEIIEISAQGDARLQVDTRKWLMSKMAPKIYGDKITHSGDEDSPLQVVVKRVGSK